MITRVKLPKFKLIEPEAALRAALGSLFRSATNIMADSKVNYVPVETGTLRSSGVVNMPVVSKDRATIEFGYGGPAAPYAFYIHENPRAGKTGGISPAGHKYRRWAKVGQWKFLEIPFEQARRGIGEKVARAIGKAKRS